MKKLVSVFALSAVMAGSAVAATPVPSHITRDGRGGYDVTYSYKDKAKTGWYGTARAGVSFLNFTSKQKLDGESIADDDFSFEPVFDGSISVGHHFDHFWRGELEFGYMGQFSDSDAGLDFDLSVPYLMANGYYDFTNGLYLGAGVGLAIPVAHLDGVFVTGGDRDKTTVSPMAGIMAGWTTQLDDNLVLDLRYRLAGYMGPKQDIDVVVDGVAASAQAKIDMIWDNTISVGLRYEF